MSIFSSLRCKVTIKRGNNQNLFEFLEKFFAPLAAGRLLRREVGTLGPAGRVMYGAEGANPGRGGLRRGSEFIAARVRIKLLVNNFMSSRGAIKSMWQ